MSRFEQIIRLALLGAFLAAIPARANIIINAYFDSTITSDPKKTQIENTILTAVTNYESMITNNITVSIYFQEGGGLGESNYDVNLATYKSFYDGLVSNNSNPAAVAALNANGGDGDTNGGVNPVDGGSYLEIKSANERAIGIAQAPQCYVTPTNLGTSDGNVPNQCGSTPSSVAGALQTAVDGIVSLNTAITNPGGGSYDLLSTAEHEMDEVLGLGSALENVQASAGTENSTNDTAFASDPLIVADPEDLYRWSAKTGGTRTLSTNCANPSAAYFSYGPSTGVIEQFNNSCNGDDFGDWASSASAHIQDAVATPNSAPTFSTAEIDALSAIGYDITVPEPSTWLTMAGSLIALGFLGRKRLIG